MPENIKNYRKIYEKIQIILSISAGILAFVALRFELWELPESIFGAAIMYIGVPLLLLSLYLTSIRKVFPQRIGDVIHICVALLVISNFNLYYGNGIGSYFVFLFFLLIILSSLLLDEFIPLFTGVLVSLILIGEFFLSADLTRISYIPVVGKILQIIAFLTVGWSCSSLVKRTLSEQKTSQELRKTTGELREKTQELQKAYTELKEASKNIEALSEMKSEFLKVVNHQLRTPVSIIKGMSSILAEGTLPQEKQKDFIQKLYLSSERLTTILDDILTAQALVGGIEKPKLAPCQIEEIVKSQIEHLKSRAEAKDLKILYKKPKETLPITLADPEMLKRILSRLIDNAILYTEKGKIEASLTLKKDKDKDFIQISVRDTGIGLDKEDKKNLCKLFYRGDRATHLHTNGSGLGLFIVKNLIEAHQGKIEAKSKGRDKGSTFIVRLPVITEV